ncbi:MAG: hypothetical protein ABSF12_25535, partial [Bryobacteraceae bacterium]
PAVGSRDAHSSATLAPPPAPIRYMSGTSTSVTFQKGAEQIPPEKEKTNWGANGKIALLGQPPVLTTVLQQAQAAGKITWIRWETISGKQAAVYSFAVDKKNTHYAVNYCCFPEMSQAGPMTMRGGSGSGAGTAPPGGTGMGNYLTNATWRNLKLTVPYHGQVFVDPDSGIIVRLDTEAEFKSSELVRQENQCINYGVVTVGDKPLVLPVRAFIDTLALPYGDDEKGRTVLRHTLFTTDYKNYELAGAAH